MSKRLGLIAGNGALTTVLAKNAAELGVEVYVAAHLGETDANLKSKVADLTWVKVGQIGKIIKYFKRHNISEAVMLGGISKASKLRSFRPDWRGIKLLANLKLKGDDALLRALAAEFEKDQIKIISPVGYLQDCLAPEGYISSRTLTANEIINADLGWQVAKGVGSYEIGQTVVTYKGIVVAVEAIEGTDAAIERAGKLVNLDPKDSQNDGLVVVKTSKPQQDLRLDLPAVGIKTLDVMKAAGVSALILEAQHCLIQDPVEFAKLAEKLQIAVQGRLI